MAGVPALDGGSGRGVVAHLEKAHQASVGSRFQVALSLEGIEMSLHGRSRSETDGEADLTDGGR